MTTKEYTFMKTLTKFWQFDIFNGQYILSQGFSIPHSLPINLHFENFGLTNSTLVLNSGPVLIFQFLVFMSIFLRYLVNKVCLCYPQQERIRALGMFIYVKKTYSELLRLTLRLMDECYFMLSVSSFIYMRYMIESKEAFKGHNIL